MSHSKSLKNIGHDRLC